MAQQLTMDQQKQILEERMARRSALRTEFLKLKSDPFKHGSNEGGTVFDPAIQRFIAMKVNQFEHFQPTAKNVRWGLGVMVIPMVAYGYALWSSRNEMEQKYRRGEVAYKDRKFKLI